MDEIGCSERLSEQLTWRLRRLSLSAIRHTLKPIFNSRLLLPMPTVADACRICIVPKLHAADWDNDFIAEQRGVGCLDKPQAADTVELGRNG